MKKKDIREKEETEIEAEQRENPLGTEPVGRLLRQFAIPSIISMVVIALYNLVDQFFIGQSIGELGNAATNVAFPLTTVCTAAALLLGIGGAAAFNLTLGKGDRAKALYYVGNAATLLFSAGLVLCMVTLVFLTPLLRFFGSPDDVLGYAQEYVGITALGFPFIILSNGGAHLVRADGSPRYSMFCNLSGAIINTVLDPIFIFGFHMGMKGAALATIIGQIFAGWLVFRYLRHYKAGSLKRCHLTPRWKYTGYLISLGMSAYLNQLAIMVVQIVMNNSLTYYGALSVYGEAVPLACVGIISKVNHLFFSVCIGIAQGMQPISSFNYGAARYDRVRQVFRLSFFAGTVISVIAFVLFQFFPREIIALFGEGSEAYFAFAVEYFRIYLFFTFLNNIQPLATTFFTSIGKPGRGSFLALTRQILFLLPLMLLLPRVMGIDGILYAGPIADFAAATLSLILVLAALRQMQALERRQGAGKNS